MRSTLLDGVRLDEAARRILVERRALKRAEDLRVAAAFDRVAESRHFLAEGCASIGEFGERLGYSASESRMLARVGKAVRLRPSVRTLVLKGRLTLEGASVLERVLSDPLVGGAFPLRQWLYFAKTETARTLRLRVKRRIEELRSRGPMTEVTIHLSPSGLRDFDRARDLLSDRASRDVSESEAVERLSDYYLSREDPDRASPGTRRVGDTSRNRSRHVPEQVKRAIRARADRKCEMPFCDRTRDLEIAHVVAHSAGGNREVDGLVEACHAHHVALDSGWIEAEIVRGRPVFRRARGDRPARWGRAPNFHEDPLASRVAAWPVSRPPPVG